MITIHHLNASRSTRPLWLLEELGVPYETVLHQRDAKTRLAPAALREVHPLGKAPVMVDGDVTLAESGAMLDYIVDVYGADRLRPARGTQAYYRYLEWLHFAEGSLSLPLLTRYFMSMEERAGDKPMDGYIAKEIATDMAYIEATLAERPFFAGEAFTAADVMMTFPLEMAAGLGLLKDRPNTQAYLERIHARPAYRKAKTYG